MPLRQTRWPIFIALAVGCAVAAALWFVVLSNPKGEATPASGGRYIEGVATRPERINPLFAPDDSVDDDLASLIFSGLIRLSPDGTPLPDLAERWEITGDGQRYTFYLRQGVAWQDAERTEFTADDVVFTFNAIADPGFKGDQVLAQVMRGVVVSARDSYTVEFRLEQPYAPFLAYLDVGILPEYLLRGLNANDLFNAEFNSRPIGTGRYRFAGATQESVRLETNSTYYLGPPRISALEFRFYESADALTGALRTGEIDGALFGPAASQPDLEVLGDDDRFRLHDLSGTSFIQIYLDTRAPQFSDAAVREALFHSINRESLLLAATGGRGIPSDVGIPKASWAYTPIEMPQFDPGEAARMLEIAGWQRARDGIRRKGDVRLAFTISTSNDPQRVKIAEEAANQIRSLGADVTVQPLEASTFIEEHLLTREFEAALVEVDPGPDPDPYPFWHSTQIAPPGRNLSGFSDPRLDDALERARQTTDTQRRRDLYELYGGIVIAAMPVLPLYAPAQTYVQHARVQGFEPSLLFTNGSRFASVGDWYIKTRVR